MFVFPVLGRRCSESGLKDAVKGADVGKAAVQSNFGNAGLGILQSRNCHLHPIAGEILVKCQPGDLLEIVRKVLFRKTTVTGGFRKQRRLGVMRPDVLAAFCQNGNGTDVFLPFLPV